MHVKVIANWTPSVSTDVDFVELVWSLNGSEAPAVNVSPDVDSAESPYSNPDGNRVGLKVTVVGLNGLRSVATTTEVDVPNEPVAPQPVTGLALNVVHNS